MAVLLGDILEKASSKYLGRRLPGSSNEELRQIREALRVDSEKLFQKMVVDPSGPPAHDELELMALCVARAIMNPSE